MDGGNLTEYQPPIKRSRLLTTAKGRKLIFPRDEPTNGYPGPSGQL